MVENKCKTPLPKIGGVAAPKGLQTGGGCLQGGKMAMRAGIKPVFSEFLLRGDGRENIARRCASVRKGKI